MSAIARALAPFVLIALLLAGWEFACRALAVPVYFLPPPSAVGRALVSDWPGLREDKLYEGRDLAPTTDMRALLKGVLTGHLRLPAAEIDRSIFPDARSVRRMMSRTEAAP